MADTKITILVGEEAVKILDAMVENSNCGSRGRTIELLINTIASGEQYVESFMAQTEKMMFTPNTNLEIARGIQLVQFGELVGRLARFYPRKTKEPER